VKHHTLIWEHKVYEVVSHMNSSILDGWYLFIREVFHLSAKRDLDRSKMHVQYPLII
jgi:hypothetical protein